MRDVHNKGGFLGAAKQSALVFLCWVHAGFAELFLAYQRMIQSGWYEVLECAPGEEEPGVCPVRQLIAPQSIQNEKDMLI
ncbi:MAG: hypothetical protein QE278_01330 [Limnobacter sp.]|nr:hypothetical protein [Limnobacter sp.]